jgi:ribosomal protein S18 acetylase RimI-like enzyme
MREGGVGENEAATIAPATATDGPEIATLYLAARADALPYLRRVHSDAAVKAWITSVLLRDCETWVARLDDRIVGFMALNGPELDQLYVLPKHYRCGIGSRLLQKAKERRPEGLRLFTFQRNASARAFYDGHGFCVIDMNDGARNEENEPDIHYAWRPAPPETSGAL